MKIKNMNGKKLVKYSELKNGDVFEMNNKYYMKLPTLEKDYSVQLDTGNLYYTPFFTDPIYKIDNVTLVIGSI